MESIWLARDKDGNLWGYIPKPIRREEDFVSGSQINSVVINMPNHHFQEVTWENSPIEFIQNKEKQ